MDALIFEGDPKNIRKQTKYVFKHLRETGWYYFKIKSYN